MAIPLFDFLGIESKSDKQAREFKERSADLAERKFQAQQQASTQEASQKQADRLLQFLDRSDLSPQARKAIGQKLSSMPQFAGLTQQTEQGVNPSLFDFAAPKQQVSGEFREGTVTQTDPKTGKTTVLQQPLPTKTLSPKERVFDEMLTPEQQVDVVLGQGKGQTINVNVDTGDADVPLTGAVQTVVQNDIIEISDQIKEIVDLGSQFEDQFLTIPGRMRAGTAAVAEKFLTIPPAKTEAFLEKVGIVDKADADLLRRRTEFLLPAYTILNERIKEITGAAVREGEEGRLGQSTVDPTKDGPTQFRAKRDVVEGVLRRQKKEKLILLSRGIAYNKENVESIPIGSVDAIFKREVLGEQLTPQEQIQNKVNTVKNAAGQGKATVSNTPTSQNTPKTVEDKIQRQETIKAVGSADKQINATTFSISHPKSMARIAAGLREGSLTNEDLGSLLKVVAEKKLTDDRVEEILQELLGGQ